MQAFRRAVASVVTCVESVLVLKRLKKREAQSEVELRLIQALRQRAAAGGGSGKSKRPVHFNSVALKFPKADEAFREIRKEFDKFDADHSNSIDLQELKECFAALQVQVSDEEVGQFYEEADMDCSDGVQFKEFILLLAFVYLLKPTADESPRFGLPQVEAAFGLICDSFNFFDKDGDGYLTKDEILATMSSGKEAVPTGAGASRFAEMDYNTDGKCSFKEFLFAYVGWVGTAEEDEDDEEEGQGESS